MEDFTGSWWTGTAELRCFSTTAMGCTVFTTTSRRTRSILLLKPKRFWPCVLNSEGWIPAGLESSSPVALFWRIGRSSRASTFCRQLRHGFFEMAHSSEEAAISIQGSGKNRKHSIRNHTIGNSEQTFTRNLPRYFAGHERIGMSLTGGLDTRMILACQKSDPGSLPCYTFGSMFRENQDVRVARRVADVCKQPHQILTAGQEFLSQFARYAERAVYLTDGCVDVSRAPDLYLKREGARNCSGQDDGKLWRGSPPRCSCIQACRASRRVVQSESFSLDVHQAAETYAEVLHGHPVSFAVFKQAPWYLHGVLALEQTQLSMRSPYLDNDFVRTVFRSPASALVSNEVSLRLIADGNRTLLRVPTDRGLGGNRGRISGAISRGLLEFLFKAEYAYDMGMPQWLARLDHAFSPLRLERLFLGRHKPFHFRVWYRDALADYLKEVLLDPRSLSRPWVDRSNLEAMLTGHIRGNRNYTNEIHKLLTLELLHRVFFDSETGPLPSSRVGIAACIA